MAKGIAPLVVFDIMSHEDWDYTCVYQFNNLKQETSSDSLINLTELEL